MRKHGGKMYYASNKLTKPEKAGYMPDFEGSNVKREKVHTTEKLLGKISLMSFVYAKYGEPHVNSFVDPFLVKFKGTDGVQCIEVSRLYLYTRSCCHTYWLITKLNVQENILKQLVLKAFIPSIRKNLADDRKVMNGCSTETRDIDSRLLIYRTTTRFSSKTSPKLEKCWTWRTSTSAMSF